MHTIFALTFKVYIVLHSLIMEKATEHETALAARYVEITPEKLRMIADRLELAATNAAFKDKVTYPVLKDLVLYYDVRDNTKVTQ